MSNNDLIIVHSHELEEDGTPKIEYKSRLDKAVEIIKDKSQENCIIILTGGKATKGVNVRHCDSGREYLLDNGVNDEILLLESENHNSLETVGEAIFAYQSFKEYFYNAPSIGLISSDYHEKRIMAIQRFILGKISHKLSFIGIDRDVHENFSRTLEQEENSLQAFYNTFRGINPGDIEEINKRLYKNHPLYKKNKLV